jgi:hypothetical protein
MNAGIRHAENAVPCTVARDVTEVTWSFRTVAWPNSYCITSNTGTKRREGRGGKMRQRSAAVVQPRSMRFLNFITSRMGWLCHYIYIYNPQHYWVFRLRPSSGILKTRKHNISETGSISETLCSLLFGTLDDGQSPKHPVILSFTIKLASYKQLHLNH